MSTAKLLLYASFLVTAMTVFTQPENGLQQEMQELLSTYHEKKAFNGYVLVAREGEVLYEGGWGYANAARQESNSANTKFLIGSATKSFTAIAVLQAVEKGLLDLHTPIKQYLNGISPALGGLTLHILMKNASGLPVHLNRITTLEYRDISSAELVDIYNTIELAFSPGTQYAYSNLNYQLCALVLESVTGMSYKDYVNQHLLAPLGMLHSGVQRTHDSIAGLAMGYTLEGSGLIPAPENHIAYAKGGGDIYSTARDLLKWDQGLYGDKLLKSESRELLFDGHPDAFGTYGYGFKVKTYIRGNGKTGKLVRHGGSMYGFICNIHRYLDDKAFIVVLGNMRPYPTMEITEKMEALLRKHHFFED